MGLVTVAAGAVLAAPTAMAAADSTPPSVPQNLRTASESPGERPSTVLNWDAATDDSGSIFHYWVIVDGKQRAKPVRTIYDLRTLVLLDRIVPGRHTVAVQSVDRALNRSAPSEAIVVVVP